jgi:hypothetical protein
MSSHRIAEREAAVDIREEGFILGSAALYGEAKREIAFVKQMSI